MEGQSRAGNSHSFLPLLTLLSIFFISLIPISVALAPMDKSINEMTYQNCAKPEKSFWVEPPKEFKCDIPDDFQNALELEAELIVRRTRPITFPIFKCTKKSEIKCTFSVFKIFTSAMETIVINTKIPMEDCNKMVTNGKLGNDTLIRKNDNVWATDNKLIIEYAFVGNQCFSVHNYIVERTTAAVMTKTDIIQSDLAVKFGDCRVLDSYCENDNAMIVWKTPEPHELCEYVSTGKFMSVVANKYVIIEKFQSIFVFKEGEQERVQEADNRVCFPKNTYAMENDIFIAFPNISYFLTSDHSLKPIRRE